MSPEALDQRVAKARFPRVSGDEPRRFLIVEVAEKFSPRERG